jgi:polyferredoxin
MDKVNKPHGLIRYSSENQLRGETRKIVTPRSILYAIISMIFLTTLITFVSKSGDLKFQFYRGIESPYQLITDANGKAQIMNHFTLKVTHQGDQVHFIKFQIHDEEIKNNIQVVTVMNPLKFDRPENKVPIFFKFEPSILKEGKRILLLDVLENEKYIKTIEVPLVGPR